MSTVRIKPDQPPVVLSPTAHLVPPDVLEGLHKPYLFGYNKGIEWVKTASIEAIAEAATRMTSNQQIELFYNYYNKRVAAGLEGVDGNIFITYPTQRYFGYGEDFSEEITDFFEKILRKYFYFNGSADETDKQVCSTCDNFYISEAPNHEFRQFEDGWAEAAREHYKSLLLSHKNQR